jgi:MoaA/NifB/PqqE/SkfB family radical SAM enzyme
MLRAPLQLELRITDCCNLRCKYCYAMPFSDATMNVNEAKRVIDQAKEMGVFLTNVAGGEPLLHPKFLEILEYLLKQSMASCVLTNGTLITKDTATTLRELVERYDTPFSIQVSLDAVDGTNDVVRGQTDKAKQGIEALLEVGIRPNIGSVITAHNVNSVPALIREYYPRVRAFNVMPLMLTPKAMKNEDELIGERSAFVSNCRKLAEELLQLKEEFADADITIFSDKDCFQDISEVWNGRCAAGDLVLIVKANLDVIPCNMAPSVVIGNLSKCTLQEVWDSIELKRIRRNETYPCILLPHVFSFLPINRDATSISMSKTSPVPNSQNMGW